MKDIQIENLINVMKHKHLVDAVNQYSDYVKDIGGKSIEEFVHDDYLKNKSLENVIVKSELSEEPETLENVISTYLADYVIVEDNVRNTHCVPAEVSQCVFDEAVAGFKFGIDRYLKDNY